MGIFIRGAGFVVRLLVDIRGWMISRAANEIGTKFADRPAPRSERNLSIDERLAVIRGFECRFPAGFKFDRDEANCR